MWTLQGMQMDMYIENVTSATTGEEFEIYDFIHCSFKGIIYKATCTCPYDYIGKTKGEWRKRVLEHIRDIRHERDTPLARHLNTVIKAMWIA